MAKYSDTTHVPDLTCVLCSAKRIYVNMAPTYYDFANIRAMLAEGYSNEELLRLCFYVPEFQSFYRDWQGVPISTERLIQEYSDSHTGTYSWTHCCSGQRKRIRTGMQSISRM